MLNKSNLPTLILLAAIITLGCSRDVTPEEQFVGKTPEERQEYIKGLPIDQKLHFYLYAMRRIRPRPVDLAVGIAQGGEINARVIANRIQSSNDISERNNLLTILISMREMNIYDSCSNSEIRRAIAPSEYSVDNSEGQLRYALSFIDLCIGRGSVPPTAMTRPATG